MKKKEKSTLIVLLTIFFLSLFIVLPPTFRNMFPKEKENVNQNQNKITALMCNREVSEEQYTVSTKTLYNETGLNKATLTYTLNTETQVPSETETTELPVYSAVQEITMFRALSSIVLKEEENKIIVTLPASLSGEENTLVTSHLQELTTQKAYYENLGFTCNTMES